MEELLAQFPAQKNRFLENVQTYVENLGYPVKIESGRFGCRNLLVGDPKQANFLISAGTARSGMFAWLEMLRTFPENQRHKVCFVLFDGKTGMSFFCKRYQPVPEGQLLIHLEHVGDGNHMRIYPTKQIKVDRQLLTSFYRVCGYWGTKDLIVEEKKVPFFLKRPRRFPNAITIAALQAAKKGFRYPHKTKDSKPDETNINILRAALTTYICCSEVN